MHKKFSKRVSAVPPDVRKRSALPLIVKTIWGCAPKRGRSPKFNVELDGRPKAFRTSDGAAVLLKEFLGKAALPENTRKSTNKILSKVSCGFVKSFLRRANLS